MMKSKGFKRVVALVMLLVLAVSLCACSGGKSGDKVTLKWVMPGPGIQADSEEVWAEFNKKLHTYEGFENVDVEIEVMPTSEYAQKVMLMLTSGEKIDIAATYCLPYAQYARDDTFLEITPDMMKEYLADARKLIPDWAFDMTMVDGKYYCVTNYQQMTNAMWSYAFQADEAEKYLDSDKLAKQLNESPVLTDEIMDTLEDYLEALKANGELDLGMTPGSTYAKKGYIDVANPVFVYLPREDGKVVVENFAETKEAQLFMRRYADFFKKGYVRKDVLSAEINADVGRKNGYNIWLEQDYKGAADSYSKKYGFDVDIVASAPEFNIALTAAAGGHAVLSNSEYPEECLKLLNLVNSEKGKDLYRLLVYGIEDKHYKILDNGTMEPIGYNANQGDSNAPYGLWKWVCGNTVNSFETTYDPEGWNDYVFNDWNANANVPELVGFTFDTTECETEWGQLKTVYLEYIDQITYGALTDYEATYKEMLQKMKAAGGDEIKKELQRQVDEFLANKNK